MKESNNEKSVRQGTCIGCGCRHGRCDWAGGGGGRVGCGLSAAQHRPGGLGQAGPHQQGLAGYSGPDRQTGQDFGGPGRAGHNGRPGWQLSQSGGEGGPRYHQLLLGWLVAKQRCGGNCHWHRLGAELNDRKFHR